MTGQTRFRSLGVAALLALGSCGSDEGAPPDPGAAGLDFEVYLAVVEPIFTRARGGFSVETPGGPSCVMCHTWQTNGPLQLEDLGEGPDGEPYWSPEASRRNFLEVARLVTPGDPDRSRLLLAPLTESAGGRGNHTGGVFWESKDDPEWRAVADWVAGADAAGVARSAAAPPSVDFEFFRSCVQPVFMIPTPGALPCTECHGNGSAGFAPPVPDGRGFWDEEESRRNFEVVMRLIEPGEPTRSRLLMHPLRYEAGGDYTHNGPRRWDSTDDPEWQMLAAWVRGERTGSSCEA